MGAISITPTSPHTLYAGSEISADHFGANQLFDRDVSAGLSTYTNGLDALGVTTVRYPGGTITEELFDLADPNGLEQKFMPNGSIFDPDDSGPLTGTTMGLDDQLAFCAEQGLSMTFVMPTIRYAGQERDDAGNRHEAVDTQLVYDFTMQLLESAAAHGVDVTAIEIGNEWYVDNSDIFGENLSAVEYGRIASTLCATIQQAIDAFGRTTARPEGWVEPDIVVQVGPGGNAEMVTPEGRKPPSGYDGLLRSATELIFEQFDLDAEQAAVDGLLVHNYLSGDFESINGYRYKSFDTWDALAAGDPDFALADRYVTEWNVKGSNAEMYGLAQAGALVSMMTQMLRAGVDHANIWAVQQNNNTALTHNTGKNGEIWAGLTVAGEVFRMMGESLTGLRVIPITDASQLRDINVFGNDETIVIFVASTSASAQNLELDLSALAPDYEHLWATSVTTDGGDPLSPDLVALIESQMADELASGGTLHLSLDPYEVVRIVITREPVGVTMRGHDQPDRLIGSAQRDSIYGGLGDDVLEGGAAADLLDGGSGIDTASYGAAQTGVRADLMRPSSNQGDAQGDEYLGVESLAGSEHGDILRGDDGSNTISGRGGVDHLFGGGGDDLVFGGGGGDVLFGDAGRDTLRGEDGADIVFGGIGDDLVFGDKGDDLLFGGEGNDALSGGAGRNVMYGGAGSDTFRFEAGGSIDVVDFEAGIDTIAFSNGTTRLSFLENAQQIGRDVVFEAEDGSVMVIRGVTPSAVVDDLVFG